MRAATLLALALCLSCAPAEAPRLGGPEASEPVASLGAWVPAQAARQTLLAQALIPPGVAYRFVTTNQTASGDGVVLYSDTKLCWSTTGTCTGASYLKVNTGTGILSYPGNAAFNSLDTTSNTLTANTLKVPVVHGTGTAAQAIESGSAAMTTGALAVTFTTAFGAAPKCVCTHVDTTNTNPCTIQAAGAPSTTAVTFAVASGGSDVVHYFCIGQR